MILKGNKVLIDSIKPDTKDIYNKVSSLRDSMDFLCAFTHMPFLTELNNQHTNNELYNDRNRTQL